MGDELEVMLDKDEQAAVSLDTSLEGEANAAPIADAAVYNPVEMAPILATASESSPAYKGEEDSALIRQTAAINAVAGMDMYKMHAEAEAKYTNETAFNDAVAVGDADMAEYYARQAANASIWAQVAESKEVVKHAGTRAYENAAVTSDGVINNNSPEQVNTAGDMAGKATLLYQVLQAQADQLAEGIKNEPVSEITKFVWDALVNPYHEHIDDKFNKLLEKHAGIARDDSITSRTYEGAMTKFIAALAFMTEEQAIEAVTNIVSELSGEAEGPNTMGRAAAYIFVQDLLDYSPRMLRFGTIASVTSLPFDAATIASTVKAVSKGVSKLGNAERVVVAPKGGKARGENIMLNIEGSPEAIPVTQEVIEKSLISLKGDDLVTEGLAGAAPEVQRLVLAQFNKVAADLRSVVVPSGRSSEEIKDGLEALKRSYDPSVNPAVVSFEIAEEGQHGIRGTVVLQNPETGKPYLNIDFVREEAKRVGGEVVEAKASAELILPVEEVARIQKALAELDKELVDNAAIISKATAQGTPNEFAPIDNTSKILSEIAARDQMKAAAKATKDPLKKEAYEAAAEVSADKIKELKKTHGKLQLELDLEAQIAKANDPARIKSLKKALKDVTDSRVRHEALQAATKNGQVFTTKLSSVLEGFVNNKAIPQGLQDVARKILTHGVGAEEVVHVAPTVISKHAPKFDGYYSVPYDEIVLKSLKPTSAADATTLLHEVVHSRTSRLLRRVQQGGGTAYEKAVVKELEAAYEAANKAAKGALKKQYGLKNVHEMVTEAMTNPLFQKYLAGIPSASSGNMLSSFMRIIRDWLGILPDNQTVFDDVIRATEAAMSSGRWDLSPAEMRLVERGQNILAERTMLLEKLAAHEAASSGVSTGWHIVKKVDDPLSVKTVGKVNTDEAAATNFVLGMFDEIHGASSLVTSTRAMATYSGAAIRDMLHNVVAPFIKDLSRKSQIKLEKVLVEGNAASNGGSFGREFTAAELAAKGLESDAEQAAYFAMRAYRKTLHSVRDSIVTQSLRSRGYENVGIRLGKTGPYVYTPARIVDADAAASLTAAGRYAMETTTGGSRQITPKLMEKLKAEGKVLVESAQSMEHGGSHWKAFIVDAAELNRSELRTVIPYRPGEYSRIYTDDYFIKMTITKKVDGVDVPEDVTFRTARSAREAEQYALAWDSLLIMRRGGRLSGPDALAKVEQVIGKWENPEEILKDLLAGNYDNVTNVSKHYNRTLDDWSESMLSLSRATGESMFGSRGAKLPAVDNKARENTLDLRGALEAELSNTANVVALSFWRDNSINRWFNSAKAFLPDDVKNLPPHEAFIAMENKKFNAYSDAVETMLNRTYKYIANQIGARSSEEKWWEKINKYVTEHLFHHEKLRGTKVGDVLENIGVKWRNSDKIRFVRTLNTHSMLGVMNFSQLLVQANSAAVAIARHPIHGMLAAKNAVPMRVALMSDNEEVWRMAAASAGILGKADQEDFIDIVKAVRSTGILNNVASTSLYNIENGKWGIFGGRAADAMEKAKKGSLFFYNRGVETGRLISFQVAKKEWQAANKGKAWNTEQGLQEIINRMEQYEMHMNKATQGAFQRGIVSLPLQFMAYQLKFATNMTAAAVNSAKWGYLRITNAEAAAKFAKINATRNVTGKDLVAFAAGSLIMYGTQGNGYDNFITEAIGETEWWKNLSTEERLYYTQGLAAGLLNSIAEALGSDGMQLAVGSRLSPVNFYSELVDSFLGNKSTFELVSGVSYNNLRTLGAVGDVLKMWKLDPNVSAEDFGTGLRVLLTEQVASLRNAHKWNMYRYGAGVLHNARGDAKVSATKAEEWAQLLGIANAQHADMHTIYRTAKEYREHKDSTLELAQRLMWLRTIALKDGDDVRATEYYAAIQVLLQAEDAHVRDYVISNLGKPTKHGTKLREALVEHMQDLTKNTKGLMITNQTVGDPYYKGKGEE